jgi:hypothetical protein
MRFHFVLPLAVLANSGCAPGVAAPASEPIAPDQMRSVSICVVENGDLIEVTALVEVETGDTLVGGGSFSQRYADDDAYALQASWYRNNEPFTYAGVCYLKYGSPRIVAPVELRRIGKHHGVSLFAEVDDTRERPDVIYVPVRPGCWFQTYQYELVLRPCHY